MRARENVSEIKTGSQLFWHASKRHYMYIIFSYFQVTLYCQRCVKYGITYGNRGHVSKLTYVWQTDSEQDVYYV